MDGTMKYDFGQIGALAGDINTRVSSIEQILGDLGSQINNLTTIWEGAAKGGFQQVKQNWFTAADDLNRVLKQIQIAVTQTNDDAQATENKNTARWG
jgi:early secretory antigenic target protein ESAT-6